MADKSFRQSLLAINSVGRKIEMMSQVTKRIRLRSLNALILARRSGELARSYSVVAREMIQSTRGFMRFSSDLHRLAAVYLHVNTSRLRNMMSMRLMRRCGEGDARDDLARRLDGQERGIMEGVRRAEKQLLVSIRSALDWCFAGNMVATQALIEGSTIAIEGQSYVTVAREYMESVATIQSTLIELKSDIERLRTL